MNHSIVRLVGLFLADAIKDRIPFGPFEGMLDLSYDADENLHIGPINPDSLPHTINFHRLPLGGHPVIVVKHHSGESPCVVYYDPKHKRIAVSRDIHDDAQVKRISSKKDLSTGAPQAHEVDPWVATYTIINWATTKPQPPLTIETVQSPALPEGQI